MYFFYKGYQHLSHIVFGIRKQKKTGVMVNVN